MSAGSISTESPTVIATSRDRSIDAIRGVAVLFLIAFHAIPRDAAPGGFLDGLHKTIDPVIMPLFAVLSGYVYAMRPVTSGRAAKFMKNKVLRLLLPMAIAALVLLALQSVNDGAMAFIRRVPEVLFFSYEHFWFLQSLFIVFGLIALIDPRGLMNRPATWALWFVLAIIIRIVSEPLFNKAPLVRDFFSLWGVAYLLPPFLLGLAIWRFPRLMLSAWVVFAGVLLAVGMGLMYALIVSHPQINERTGRMSLIAMTLGTAVAYLLTIWRFRSEWLARIGDWSYPIYLYHAIGIAIAARLAGKISLHSAAAVFGIRFALGLLVPLLLVAVLHRWKRGYRIITGS